LRPEFRQRAEDLVALYPRPRSAMLPLLHLCQEQDGYVTPEAMEEVADLTQTTAAEVRGTATFYDMFHLEPVGAYVVGICTNVACLLGGGMEMLAHAQDRLSCSVGATTEDGMFTLEETECLADCDKAPCVTVNHRFVRATSTALFDQLVDDLRAGTRAEEIPAHGVVSRVRRTGGLRIPSAQIAADRSAAKAARDERITAREAL
jgi:NADH-quinone oxidoreductase E subunit